MGNVANWKTIGKFIIKRDFLILLIRAREGVFLLISCCDKLLWGGGVTFPHHNNLSQQLINKNTPSLALISKIKKSLLIINFPVVFQFATFPIQKLDFIRT